MDVDDQGEQSFAFRKIEIQLLCFTLRSIGKVKVFSLDVINIHAFLAFT